MVYSSMVCARTAGRIGPIRALSWKPPTIDAVLCLAGEFCNAFGQSPVQVPSVTNITNTITNNVTTHVHVHAAPPTVPAVVQQQQQPQAATRYLGGTLTVESNDAVKVVVRLNVTGAVSDYDYLTLALATSGGDDYLTYEYNANQLRRGTMEIAHVPQSRASVDGAPFQLVIRYHESQNWTVVASTPPFDAPLDGASTGSVSRIWVDMFEAGEPPSYFTAGIHVGFEIGRAASKWDCIYLCAPNAPSSAYATFSYNAAGVQAAGGASNAPGVKLEHNAHGYYVLRYMDVNEEIVAESEPFSYAPDGS